MSKVQFTATLPNIPAENSSEFKELRALIAAMNAIVCSPFQSK